MFNQDSRLCVECPDAGSDREGPRGSGARIAVGASRPGASLDALVRDLEAEGAVAFGVAADLADAAALVWETLVEATRRRLESEVPLGVFLSGGLDSTAVLAAMAQEQDPARIRTFTIGFDDPSYFARFVRRDPRCERYLRKHELPVDYRGASRAYDLALLCTDQHVPGNLRGTPIVLVQEGMLDPANPMFAEWINEAVEKGIKAGGAVDVTAEFREGERFQPLGMDGHSLRFSDYWVNKKLSRRARSTWPLVWSGERAAWAPGYQPGHAFRLTEATRRVVALHMQSSEEQARE